MLLIEGKEYKPLYIAWDAERLAIYQIAFSEKTNPESRRITRLVTDKDFSTWKEEVVYNYGLIGRLVMIGLG